MIQQSQKIALHYSLALTRLFSIFLKESLKSFMILFDITPAKLVPDWPGAGFYHFS